MKRKPFILLAIVVLVAALFVSCEQFSGLKAKRNMTEFYSIARTAFKLSTNVDLPVLENIGFNQQSYPDAYNEELNTLNAVITAGGSHNFVFDLNLGVTEDAKKKICSAITDVFGKEKDSFPQTDAGNVEINEWEKDGLQIAVSYHMDNSLMTFSIY